MHSTNYFSTLILASPDCPAKAGTAPPKAGTIAAIQYDLLSASPYRMNSDELLFAVESKHKGVKRGELAAFRKAYFSRSHACLRGSPLVKSYGWGIHHRADGKVALVGRETKRYAAMVEDPAVKKLAGMRSRRA